VVASRRMDCLALERGRLGLSNTLVQSAVAMVVGLCTLVFVTFELLGFCQTCALGIPPILVMSAGLGWILAGLIAYYNRPWTAFLLSLTLTSGHITSMQLASSKACVFCLVILLLEVSASALLYAGQLRLLTGLRHKVLHPASAICAGSISSALFFTIIWPPLPDRILQGDRKSMIDAYIIVRRDCGNCDQVERRMRECLEGSGFARVAIMDARSRDGGMISQRHGLTIFPAFVAKLPNNQVLAQNGGGIEQFLSHVKHSINHPLK
jgi:hypothetical protein